MWKVTVSIALMLVFAGNAFADHWRWRGRNTRQYSSYNRNHSYGRSYSNYNTGRISPGAATAIGIGVGVLGFVVGRASSKPSSESSNSKIECKEFDIKVIIDGEEKKAKVTKCRTEDGGWVIPD